MQPSNSRPAHSSADLDPFKFRWLIPISALQVRLGNTAGKDFGECDDKKHFHVLFIHVGWKSKASMVTRFLIGRNDLFELLGIGPWYNGSIVDYNRSMCWQTSVHSGGQEAEGKTGSG